MSIFDPSFWKALRPQKTLAGNFLALLYLSIFLLAFGQSSLYGAFPLFGKNVLGLSPSQVGVQYAVMGLIAVLIQGGLIRVLVKKFGEERLFFSGNVLFVAGLFMIPFARTVMELFLFLACLSIGASLNGPTLASLISKQSDPSRYGLTLGTSQGLAALGRAIGPAWGGLLYGFSFRMPFIVTAGIVFLTIWVGWRLLEAF